MARGLSAAFITVAVAAHGAQSFGRGTVRFEAAPEGGFIGRCLGHSTHLTPAEVTLRGDGESLKMVLPGANPAAQVVLLEPDDGVSNYLIGDEGAWRTHVPGFRRVEYRDVYPGVDAVYYSKDGRLEYDLVVRPGGEPSQIRLRFEGAEEIRMDSGDLVLRTRGGQYRHSNAEVYQIRRGKRERVAARLTLRGRDEAVIYVPEYDRSLPLTIDPVIVYSTYLGGAGTTRRPHSRWTEPGIRTSLDGPRLQTSWVSYFHASGRRKSTSLS